jgi:hypothetical protein
LGGERLNVKKLLVLCLVALVVVAVVYRQRIFLRDPLGKVERNGVRLEGANVFINYYNEVLIEVPNLAQRYLVQRGSVPGTPKNLSCLRGVMCWTDADVATVAPLGGAGYRPDVVMTSTDVSFKDGAGEGMRVELR